MSEFLVQYQGMYAIDNPDGTTDGEWRFLVLNGEEWEVKLVGSMRKIMRKMLKVAGFSLERVE